MQRLRPNWTSEDPDGEEGRMEETPPNGHGAGHDCGCSKKVVEAVWRPKYQYADGPYSWGGPSGIYRLEQLPFQTEMEWTILYVTFGGAGQATVAPMDSAIVPGLTGLIDVTDARDRAVFMAAGVISIPAGPDAWFRLPPGGHIALQCVVAGGNSCFVTVAFRRRLSPSGASDFGA